MKKILPLIILLGCFATSAQDLTQNYRKLILNSSEGVSLFQTNSTNGIWASGMITGDRWGIFEDATSTKEWLTVLPGGKVGIGITDPKGNLQINGLSEASSSATLNGHLVLSSTLTGLVNTFGIHTSATNPYSWIQSGHNSNNSTFDLALNPRGGNVGIGTTNPSAKLEIKGGNDVGISLFNDQANYWDIINSTSGKLDFVRAKTNIFMRIDQFGNVGIGTTTPDAKLAVNGNIHTKEVKVDLIGWPDFVFEKDYSLPSLEEVEMHIKEKGHLKDIPSAKEVAENGIFLGEMDSKLLQKIEELTLYTIAQENRIKQLETENSKIKVQELKIKEIEAKLNAILAVQKQ